MEKRVTSSVTYTVRNPRAIPAGMPVLRIDRLAYKEGDRVMRKSIPEHVCDWLIKRGYLVEDK